MIKRTILVSTAVIGFSMAAGAIGINPTRYEFTGRPDEVFRASFTVTNDQPLEKDIELELSEGPRALADKGIAPVQEWLQPETTGFTIAPHSSRTVYFTAKAMPEAKGTFSGRISFIDRSNEAFSTSVTVPVYITIKGTEIDAWSISSFEMQETPVGLGARAVIDNRGNLVFRTDGTLTFADSRGKKIADIPIGGLVVFPDRQTLMPLNLTTLKLPPGKYQALFAIKGYRQKERRFLFSVEKLPDGTFKIRPKR